MMDMTKEDFRRLVVGKIKNSHPGWEKSVGEVLQAVDDALVEFIARNSLIGIEGIRITDALRISIKRIGPKTYKDPRTKELRTSVSKYVARLRDSAKLRGALATRR